MKYKQDKILMKNQLILICGITSTLFLSGSAWAADEARSGQLAAPDKKFVDDAVAAGRNDVQLGQMASKKAVNPNVRDFGTRMAQDHSKSNEQLARILTEKGITEAPTMAKTTRSSGQLQAASGPDFDRTYLNATVRDQQKDIAEFKDEAANGRDPEIRTWAAQNVPLMEKHLQMAEQTQSNLTK
jgi:putative membrane protein